MVQKVEHNVLIKRYLAPKDIHEVRKESSIGAFPSLLLALLASLAHGLNVYWFVFKEETPLTALFVHLLLVIITGIIARISLAVKFDNRFLILLFMTTMFTSVFGAVGTVFAIVLYLWHARFSMPFSEWFQLIFPSEAISEPESVYEELMTGRDGNDREYSVIPFMEVLHYGTETQKRDAISKMTLRFNPVFAPAFARALKDESNMIRVQAATAITKIENMFLEKLMKLSSIYDKNPNDPEVVQALAEHYDEYAFTGILDPERERNNRDKALKHYREYLRFGGNNTDIRMRIGRILLRSKQIKEAADWFEECINAGYEDDILYVWYMEVLFILQRYDRLRKLAPRMEAYAESRKKLQPQLGEAILLWGEEELLLQRTSSSTSSTGAPA